MRNSAVLLLILFLSISLAAQKRPRASKKPSSAAADTTKANFTKPLDENEEYHKASNLEVAGDRAAALKKFLNNFPNSENAAAAKELIASSRILVAEDRLNSGETNAAVAVYKLAVEEAPDPIPDDLFEESIGKIPSNLFWHGSRPAALEVAKAIEKKVAKNAPQLVELANFYISIEDGDEALRVAQAAAAADDKSEAAYRTMAIAERLNFDLEESSRAFAKALEIDPNSLAAKRGLAETKRALGKSDEALALYRELLEKNDADLPARTGVILSLFDAGKRTEAEPELAKSLEQNPGNIILLAGAAYWYAAHGEGARAVELAQKAIDKEPRYIWSHIALARGLMARKKPVEAEQALIKARQYGNFPTLEYEIASARTQAGFYRDAVEGLRKSFEVTDGQVRTRLGGRVQKSEESFADLVAYERRASIFAPTGADDPATASQMKLLLDLDEKLAEPEPDEKALVADVDAFTKGSDKMKVHRQLYAAALLLQKKVAISKVLELAKAATVDQDDGLEVANTAASVMASELYEARSVAFSRNEFLLIPDVPRQTLSAILRGRIEELAGWALFNQGNYPEAVVRLRRSISVLPEKSAWWRSSMWRLGSALEADGKEKEALEAYVQSYKTDRPDVAKFIVVESLYKKLNGNTEGLEAAIGANRVMTSTATTAASQPETPAAEPPPIPKAEHQIEPPRPEVVIPKGVPVDAGKPVIQTEAVKIEPAKPVVEPSQPPADVHKSEREDKKVDDIKTQPSAKSETSSAVSELPPTASPAAASADTDTMKEKAKETETQLPIVPEKTVEAEKKPNDTSSVREEKPVERSAPVEAKPIERSSPQPAETEPAKTDSTPTEPEKTVARPEPSKAGPVTEKPVENTETTKSPEEPRREVEKPITESSAVKQPETDPGAPKTDAPPAKTEVKSRFVVVTEDLPAPVDLTKKPKTAAPKQTVFNTVNTDESLFKPVVITIPNSSAPASAAVEEKLPLKSEETAANAGAARKRIIKGKEIKGDAVQPCSIIASESSLSVAANGGGVGVIVGIEGEGDIKDLIAASSSPDDVQVTLEPEIAGLSGKRFYVVKSVSSTLGIFQVKFDAGCGRKEILVSVR